MSRMTATHPPGPDAEGGREERWTAEAWQAVLRRDRRRDGDFVYAVRTTGVFCRPSCPSRRPRRENALFYASPADAERAGYRPCRRCRPASQGTATERAIRRVLEIIEARPGERLTLERLGAEVGMSPYHLQRTFRQRMGVSPRVYQDVRRTERMKARLQEGDTVSRAGYEAGFGSARGAQERAAAGLGMTPGAYRRGGRGLEIRFTVLPAEPGRVLVGATDRGICAVWPGRDDASLEQALRREFPAASIVRDDAALADRAAAAIASVEGRHPGRAVPLDLHGTAFQLRVWEALRAIPPGETRSYAAVAAAMGRPTAARAVARACAANRTAVLVPCHRVVPAGSVKAAGAGGPAAGPPSQAGAAMQVGGYRWGAELKRRLLAREAGLARADGPASGRGPDAPAKPAVPPGRSPTGGR